MYNKQLYEKIIYNIAKNIKYALNEDIYKFDVTEYQDEENGILNNQDINDIIDNSFLPILLKEYNVYDWYLHFSQPPALFYLSKKNKNARSQMIVVESIRNYIESISYTLEKNISVKEIKQLYKEGNVIASIYKDGRETLIKIIQLTKKSQNNHILKEIIFDFNGNMTVYLGRVQTQSEKLQWDWNNALQGSFYIISMDDIDELVDILIKVLTDAYFVYTKINH